MAYRFPDKILRSCAQPAFTYRIEMALMDMSTFAVDFTNPTVCSISPFTDIPEVAYNGDILAGALSANDATFECKNILFASNARMADAICFWYDPSQYRWSIRILYLDGTDWVCLYWGIVDHDSAEISMDNKDDSETWKVSFKTRDCITLLESINPATFLGTTMDKLTEGYTPYSLAVNKTISITTTEPSVNSTEIAPECQGPPTDNWQMARTGFTFIEIFRVLQLLSNSIGVTATQSILHSWTFTVYDGSNDIDLDFEDLLFLWYWYKSDSSSYHSWYGLFDSEKKSSASLYGCANGMEILKRIIVPFGMKASIAVEPSSGDRYLRLSEFLEADQFALPDYMLKGMKMKPASRTLNSFKVTTDQAGTYINGGSSDNCLTVGNPIQTLNSLYTEYDWQIEPGRTKQVDQLFSGLYGKAPNGNIYSVYRITVRNHGEDDTIVQMPYGDERGRQVLGAAAATYYFNPIVGTYEHIGVYKRYQRRIEFELKGIHTDATVGKIMLFDFGSVATYNCYILSVSFDLKEQKTKIIAETGEY